jgi:hypothetical protein
LLGPITCAAFDHKGFLRRRGRIASKREFLRTFCF